ncbi:MAG TPA: UGSC family (seleno)protein [Acidobacteriota bacterium]|nr:UGSC family (seleno)protein [Acidobacteriota bacterium]
MSRFAGTLEKQYGIPTVSLSNENIVSFGIGAHFKYSTGMPLRFVGVPYPFTGIQKEMLQSYLEGKDRVSGKPLMQAIVDCLTKPLTAEEKKSGNPAEAAGEPRYLPADTEDNLQRLFKDRGWTDFNPIILPTEERVAAMLKGTSHKPNELIKKESGTFGTNRPFTVEKIAIIAVMAGAKPEYFPVILALSSQVPYMDSTTSNACMVLINGPIRKQIKMNSGEGALGPTAEANSVIGRAMTLIHSIIQGYQEGVSGFSSLSSPLRYNNVTIAENEESLPEGWKPVHVQMGYKPEDSVLSMFSGWNFVNCSGSVVEHYAPQLLMRDFTRVLAATGAATILMDPSVAKLLKNTQGFQTKEALSEWLSKNAEVPAGVYWANSIVSGMMGPLGKQGLEPYSGWQKVSSDTLIKHLPNPRNIHTIVVGGETASVWFITDFMTGKGVSIDAWK